MALEFVNDTNFILFAAKHYDNPIYDSEEFMDDLKRFKYLKRLLAKYKESGELKERLVLNHLIVLYNIFGSGATPMLFLKLQGLEEVLKPFLILLSRLPKTVTYSNKVLHTSDVPLDNFVVERLRKL